MLGKRIIACSLAVLLSPCGLANDLDDGIALDEPISDGLKKSINVNFIVRKALAQAKAAEKRGRNNEQIEEVGVGNIVISPGADLDGAVIVNLSNNTNGVVVSKKR